MMGRFATPLRIARLQERLDRWLSDPVKHAAHLAQKRLYHAGRVAFHREYCYHRYRAIVRGEVESIEWLAANRERRAEERRLREPLRLQKIRDRAARHDARRRGASGSHTIPEWLAVRRIFHERCAYCGTKTDLEQDHVVPISRGGSNAIENILPSCPSCN